MKTKQREEGWWGVKGGMWMNGSWGCTERDEGGEREGRCLEERGKRIPDEKSDGQTQCEMNKTNLKMRKQQIRLEEAK